MAYGYPEIDQQETKIYQAMSDLVRGYTPEAESGTFFTPIIALLPELKALHLKRAALLEKDRGHLIWVKELATPSQLKMATPVTLEYLDEEYRHFIQNVLNASGLSQAESLSLNALILQIMSRSMGQRLICNLNRLARSLKEARITVRMVDGGNWSIDVDPAETALGKCGGEAIDLTQLDTERKWDSPPYRESYKKKTPGAPLNHMTLQCPRNFYDRPLPFAAGTGDTPFAVLLPMTALAHELIHAMHSFRGRCRSAMQIKHHAHSPLYHLYAHSALFPLPEEFWTIELGQLSENAIRKEYNLPKRCSHRVAIFAQPHFREKLSALSLLREQRGKHELLAPENIAAILRL